MLRRVSCIVALLGTVNFGFTFGCGGTSKPASSPDEVVALEDSKPQPGSKSVERASGPEVADAMKAIESKQFDKAKALLETALQKNPNDAQAHYYMGVTLSSSG